MNEWTKQYVNQYDCICHPVAHRGKGGGGNHVKEVGGGGRGGNGYICLAHPGYRQPTVRHCCHPLCHSFAAYSLLLFISALEITGENLEDLLAYDDLFLDYFNCFLGLPVSLTSGAPSAPPTVPVIVITGVINSLLIFYVSL